MLMKEFLHPFLNPYNLSTGQIVFWCVLCAVIVPVLGIFTGKMLK